MHGRRPLQLLGRRSVSPTAVRALVSSPSVFANPSASRPSSRLTPLPLLNLPSPSRARSPRGSASRRLAKGVRVSSNFEIGLVLHRMSSAFLLVCRRGVSFVYCASRAFQLQWLGKKQSRRFRCRRQVPRPLVVVVRGDGVSVTSACARARACATRRELEWTHIVVSCCVWSLRARICTQNMSCMAKNHRLHSSSISGLPNRPCYVCMGLETGWADSS